MAVVSAATVSLEELSTVTVSLGGAVLSIRETVSDPSQLVPVDDPVNHPSHYTSGSIEVIDFIEDQKMPYHLGSAMKYICRAGKKDPDRTVEDLQKAVWYINRYIGLLRKEESEDTDDKKAEEIQTDKVHG